MNESKGKNIAGYVILLIIATGSLVIFHFAAEAYRFYTVERSFLSMMEFLPLAVLGIVTLRKPETAAQGLEYFRVVKVKNPTLSVKYFGLGCLIAGLGQSVLAWVWLLG